MLTPRQLALYNHSLNIWHASRTVTAGLPGDETYRAGPQNVPCKYEFTPNIDDTVEAAGRIQGTVIFSTDLIHMAASVDLRNGDILKNVTLLPDGSQSAWYGRYHRVLGSPRVIESGGNRRANKQSVMGMEIEHPPPGVS